MRLNVYICVFNLPVSAHILETITFSEKGPRHLHTGGEDGKKKLENFVLLAVLFIIANDFR